MRRPVGADKAGAVHREADRQVLDGDVVHDLVVGALQEGRVDGAERLVAFRRQAGGEGDGVLLGDADVEGARRELLGEEVDAGAGRHRRGDGDDALVLLRLLDQALAEHLGVGGGVRLRLRLRAGDHVEGDDAVILVGGVLRRRVAFALLRPHMDDDRAVLGVAHVLQHRQQVLDAVAVDRADVVEAELLEERAAGDHAAREFLGAHRADLQRLRQPLGELPADLAQRAVGAAGEKPRQIGGHGADRRGDRHVVVVQDHDQPRLHGAGIVQRLVGHAGRHRAVADDGDDVVGAAGKVARRRHAEPGGDRGRGMRRAEGVVFALRALGEAGEAVALAERADALAPAGQDLVRIGLMADVPDQAVARRVEDVVERDGQLDDAEAGAEMAAGDGDGVDGFRPQLLGDLRELGAREAGAGRRACEWYPEAGSKRAYVNSR